MAFPNWLWSLTTGISQVRILLKFHMHLYFKVKTTPSSCSCTARKRKKVLKLDRKPAASSDVAVIMRRNFQPWAKSTQESNLSARSVSLYLLTLPNLRNAITSIEVYPPALIYPKVVRQAATEKVNFDKAAERNKGTVKIQECCWEWQHNRCSNYYLQCVWFYKILSNFNKKCLKVI